jgi:glycerol kinase
MGTHLILDIGTSSLRAAIVTPTAKLINEVRIALLPTSPFTGAVEFDPLEMASVALRAAQQCIDTYDISTYGSVKSVGITCQRASTVLWDVATGEPVGPGIGWQDVRTAGMCLMWNAQGLNLAPNQSATKLAFLLDMFDPDRSRSIAGQLKFGTVDTWIAWKLSGGAIHVTDNTNAAVTGIVRICETTGVEWDPERCATLNIPTELLPRIVDSAGIVGPLIALPGAPLLAGIVGDQQASLIGQGCVQSGVAKMTFGTGGMLDMVTGPIPPAAAVRNDNGTVPIVAWSRGGAAMWGLEAIMLSAGTCVEWLRDDLGIISTAAESEVIAASCPHTGGVMFVPALLGLGTPQWDYGARGTLLGMTRGTGKAEIVRAVLEGIAHRGADLVDAMQTDAAKIVRALRVDGGMSQNGLFVQAVANATQLSVEVSPVVEATALGAGLLAGLATGTWGSFEEIAATWAPVRTVEPNGKLDRDRWRQALARSEEWLPDLSALTF